VKIKLDENIGARGREALTSAGHDVATVHEERLGSATDETLIAICQEERRCLVTLDLDFSNPLIFPPREYSGIAVLRLPAKPAPGDLLDALVAFARVLENASIAGKLWIIQRDRVREYSPDTD
jgi:hypothetical protein